MDLKQIKELMAAMEKAGLKRIRIKDKDKYEIELERNDEPLTRPTTSVVTYAVHPEIHPKPPSHHIAPSHHRGVISDENLAPHEKKVEGKFITAPLVGTIYHAASPEDPPFVKVGDRVDEHTVVCIIEAMKVMNEVKAGMSGTIAEILVTNAHPVEFGEKLIRIV